ncbi:MAG: hypothetical protein IPM17_07200 [Verrucomicrobia bacterium]|nr:hypothetical protein [Verrucomicrobiota bacterium]
MKLVGFILAAGVTAVGLLADESPPPANLAAFGFVSRVSADGSTPPAFLPALTSSTNAASARFMPEERLLVEWEHPRPVRAVELRFAGAAPDPRAIRVEWWHCVWPDADAGGFSRLDDPFNGRWVRALVRSAEDPGATNAVRLEFGSLGPGEVTGVQRTGLTHRVTYRLRIGAALPVELRHLAVFSDAVERTARLRFEWEAQTTVPGEWNPTFEARNGRLREMRKTSARSATVTVDYADAPDPLSPDRGCVIFRSGETRSFAVFVDEVLREGGLHVRDVGVFVSDAARQLTFSRWSGPGSDVWSQGTVLEQVSRLPEESFSAARAALPERPRTPLRLGVPDLRQSFVLLPDGDFQLRADALRVPGPDSALVGRPWPELTYDFETGERPRMGPDGSRRVTRSLEEGWLPIVHHAWREGGMECEQVSLAAPLRHELSRQERGNGSAPVVLATQFTFRNPTEQVEALTLWLELSRPEPLRVSVDNTLLLSRPSDHRLREGVVPVRGHFNVRGQGRLELAVLTPDGPGSYNTALADPTTARDAIRYQVELAPGAKHAIEFFVPYLELQTAEDLAALKRLSFDRLRAAVREFWEQRQRQGMAIAVPEPWLNDFFKANLWRVLISSDVDPASGLHHARPGLPGEGNLLRETAVVARSLEMRGEHDAAVRLLEPFVVSQGKRGPPGNFLSREAVLGAAYPDEPDPYTGQTSVLDHGIGMWAVAEHFAWSRDPGYLRSVVPRLIGAADWVTRERAATRFLLPDGRRPPEYGLPPAAALPGAAEYQHWYAASGYLLLGMTHVLNAAGALALHPETDPALRRAVSREVGRLDRDLKAFTADLRVGLAEAVATAPAVRLRDGRYIPRVPPRVHSWVPRSDGWFRATTYSALHLVNCGVLSPGHPFVEWMTQDLEDNLLLGGPMGAGGAAPATEFLHARSIAHPPLSLDLPMVYLRQDRIPPFLRAFYNTAAARLHPDVVCFVDPEQRPGEDTGFWYQTGDECRFIQWLRQMLILENGDRLELGMGVPRAWMADGQVIRVERAATLFGRLNLEIVSRVAEKRILARVALEPTVTPGSVLLRLRDPESRPMRSASVNGQRARLDRARQLIELPPTSRVWEVEARF